MQALVRSPAYVRVHRVGGRLTRPLRQLSDLVAIVRCDLTRDPCRDGARTARDIRRFP